MVENEYYRMTPIYDAYEAAYYASYCTDKANRVMKFQMSTQVRDSVLLLLAMPRSIIWQMTSDGLVQICDSITMVFAQDSSILH